MVLAMFKTSIERLIFLGLLFWVLSPELEALGQMYNILLVHSDHERCAG